MINPTRGVSFHGVSDVDVAVTTTDVCIESAADKTCGCREFVTLRLPRLGTQIEAMHQRQKSIARV